MSEYGPQGAEEGSDDPVVALLAGDVNRSLPDSVRPADRGEIPLQTLPDLGDVAAVARRVQFGNLHLANWAQQPNAHQPDGLLQPDYAMCNVCRMLYFLRPAGAAFIPSGFIDKGAA